MSDNEEVDATAMCDTLQDACVPVVLSLDFIIALNQSVLPKQQRH